jgi:hypothetical protein
MLSTFRSTLAIQIATFALFLCIIALRIRTCHFTRQTKWYACFALLGLLLLWYRRNDSNNSSQTLV